MTPSTFSIVAVDPATEEVGVAVQSKFLAIGAIVPWARAGVGAVATQAFADVTFGPRGLDLLASGLAPAEVLARLLEGDERRELRQVGLVDASGRSASFTGTRCYEHAGSITGSGYACQGNTLASDRVIPAMAEAFLASRGPLPERLLAALRAAQEEGGDRRGQEAAALVVARPGGGYGGNHDRYIDLRVDHHDRPIDELARLLELHRLYFERPRESEVVVADAQVESELRELLGRVGWAPGPGEVWGTLFDYLGWENLEERWVGPGRVDQTVVKYLRRQAAGAQPGRSGRSPGAGGEGGPVSGRASG
jgi:uncharacterized Ntn-hydrolase superfamily protein